jgi:hypothetical protein
MISLNATDVRKSFSEVIDKAVRERPVFIKRTRDNLMLANIDLLSTLFEGYVFTAERFYEADGSVTLTLDQIDIAVNALSEQEAVMMLARDLYEYALDYYNNYQLWSISPNRKNHLPYILKILITGDILKIKELISCRDGVKR